MPHSHFLTRGEAQREQNGRTSEKEGSLQTGAFLFFLFSIVFILIKSLVKGYRCTSPHALTEHCNVGSMLRQ